MPKELLKRVYDIYDSIDLNSNGRLDKEELGLLHKNPDLFVASIETDATGHVSYPEWEAFMVKNYHAFGEEEFMKWLDKFDRILPLSPSQEQRLIDIHRSYDRDQDGRWNQREIDEFSKDAPSTLKTRLDDKLAQKLITMQQSKDSMTAVNYVIIQVEMWVASNKDEELTLEDWLKMWVAAKRSESNDLVEDQIEALQTALPLSQDEDDKLECLFTALDANGEGFVAREELQDLDHNLRRRSPFPASVHDLPMGEGVSLQEFKAIFVEMKRERGSQQLSQFIAQAEHKVDGAKYWELYLQKRRQRTAGDPQKSKRSGGSRGCAAVLQGFQPAGGEGGKKCVVM